MTKSVEIVISPDGSSIMVDAIGFKGPSCEEFTTAISNALGTTKNADLKPEYWECEGEQESC
jgi:hypothetical protein